MTLRPFRDDDLPRMREWMRNPDTARTWARAPVVPDHLFEDDLAGKFSRFDESGYFAIDDASGHLIGRIEYEQLHPVDRCAEVMVMLGEPTTRGKGLGTDAMVTLLRHLFEDRQLHRAWLTVIASNEPAIASYKKAGFVVEGRLKDDVWIAGETHDQLVMGILRYEFQAKWAKEPEDS